MPNVKFFITVLTVSFGWTTGQLPSATIPIESWCANTDCTAPISTGLTSVHSTIRSENFVTFARGKSVQILARSLDGNVYGISYQGQRGFAHARHIQEDRIIQKQDSLLKVPSSQIPWVKSKPKPVQPAVEDKPAEATVVEEKPLENSTDANNDGSANAIPVEEPIVVKKEAYLTTQTESPGVADTKEPQLELVGAETVPETLPAETDESATPQSSEIPSEVPSDVTEIPEKINPTPSPDVDTELNNIAPDLPVKEVIIENTNATETIETVSAEFSETLTPEKEAAANTNIDTNGVGQDVVASESAGTENIDVASVKAEQEPIPVTISPEDDHSTTDADDLLHNHPHTTEPSATVAQSASETITNDAPAVPLSAETVIEVKMPEIVNTPEHKSTEVVENDEDDYNDDDEGDDEDDEDGDDDDLDVEEVASQGIVASSEETTTTTNVPLSDEVVQQNPIDSDNATTDGSSHTDVDVSMPSVAIDQTHDHHHHTHEHSPSPHQHNHHDDVVQQNLTDSENATTDGSTPPGDVDVSMPSEAMVEQTQHHLHHHHAHEHNPSPHQHNHHGHNHGHAQHQPHLPLMPPPSLGQLAQPTPRPKLQFDENGRLIRPGQTVQTPPPQPSSEAIVNNPETVASSEAPSLGPDPVVDIGRTPEPTHADHVRESLGVGSVHEVNGANEHQTLDEADDRQQSVDDVDADEAPGVVSDVWTTIGAWFESSTANTNDEVPPPSSDEASSNYHHEEIPVKYGNNDYCEPLTGDSSCPNNHAAHYPEHGAAAFDSPSLADASSASSSSAMQTISDEASLVTQLFVEHMSGLTATIAYTTITGLIVLLFLFGERFVRNRGREQALLSKLNIVERKLMTSAKECEQLRAQLVNAVHMQEAIEKNAIDPAELVALKRERERSAQLQTRIEELEGELDTATEAGLELNRMVSELLSNQSGSDSIISSVEEMQQQLNEQEEMTTTINALLAEKCRENSELQVQLAAVDGKYNTELADVVTLNEQLQADVARAQAELAELREQSEAQAKQAAAANALAVATLSIELDEVRETYETVRLANVSNESRVQVLEDLVKELRGSEAFDGKLLDAAQHKTELLTLGKEKDRLADKLEGETDARRLLEDHVRVINEEMSTLRQGFNAAEKDKLEAQTRLEVLSTYFKEKETQLQKELSLKEAISMKQQGETTSTVERIRGLQTEIQDLRSQNDSLKAEIEAQQAAHKAQLSAAENRAHESWLGARQTQRRFEETVAEAGALRRKLTSLSASGTAADGSLHTTLDGADGSSSLASPLLLDPAAAAINPGAPAHLMGVPAAFHPLPPFMGPPPPLLPPLGYMPQPPPPLLSYLGSGPGGLALPLPPPPAPPGEMRPPPLGRLMSPPPLGAGNVSASAGGVGVGGRYSPLMDGRDHRYHRGGGGGGGSGRYTPDDYAYDSDDDRHYDEHHHQRGGGGGRRSPPYDPETDFSPPPSPDQHRYHHQQRDGGGRIHHNPATSRGSNGAGVGGGHRGNLYSPPRSIKSDTTSRSKAGGLSSGSIDSLGSRKSHHGANKA